MDIPNIPYVYLVITQFGMSAYSSAERAQQRKAFLSKEWKRLGFEVDIEIRRMTLND